MQIKLSLSEKKLNKFTLGYGLRQPVNLYI